MKICYIDESGHCGEKFNPKQPVEVFCGVITDITKLFKTQKEHSKILDYLLAEGIQLEEFKATEMYKGRGAWDQCKPQFRDSIYGAILNWAQERKCKFIVCPIDAASFFDAKNRSDDMAKALSFPWEAGALNIAMAIQREYASTKNNKGRTIVIFDEQEKHDGRFLKLFEGEMSFSDPFTGFVSKKAKGTERFSQIIDIPHFSKSHLSVLIQVADLGAYVVNRYILMKFYGFSEDYAGEFAKIERWYCMIASNLITPTSIDAPGKDMICEFYRSLRPKGWSAKGMKK